jgi:hypothetical protein
LLVSFFVSGKIFSQAASPYSRYGLGFLHSTVFSANKGMGEVAAPYASAFYINYTNPASYASLVKTTIEIGANVDGANIVTKDSTYSAVRGNLSHFAIAFVPIPKRNNFAISLGLLPFTHINYSFIQDHNDSTGLGNYREVYNGKGSLYQAYAGGAYKVKGFSIGANFGFLFGKLDYQKSFTFPDSIYAYGTRNITNLNVKSFIYNVGVQYQHRIFHSDNDPDARTDIFFMVGAYGSGGMKMTGKLSNYWERFDYTSLSGFVSIDTAAASFNQKVKISLPFNVGSGIMFGNERFWLFGMDFKYMNWGSYQSPLNNAQLTDSWRFSFGGQITPKFNEMDKRKYFNRVQFRAGGYYGKSEIYFNKNNFSEAGATFGLGFPFKRAAGHLDFGSLNISGDFGTRGSNDKSLIRENYYRLTFGLVLNDTWFLKKKFD